MSSKILNDKIIVFLYDFSLYFLSRTLSLSPSTTRTGHANEPPALHSLASSPPSARTLHLRSTFDPMWTIRPFLSSSSISYCTPLSLASRRTTGIVQPVNLTKFVRLCVYAERNEVSVEEITYLVQEQLFEQWIRLRSTNRSLTTRQLLSGTTNQHYFYVRVWSFCHWKMSAKD